MSATDDSEARRRIEQDLDATFLVEAAAGTGKTTSLVRRVVATVGAGVEVSRIVAVTFTDKAAGELVFRLRDGLERAKAGATGPARLAYARALAHLEEAHIKTIHRFAGDLVRSMPVEAGVDPHFAALSQGESDALFDEAFGGWLEGAVERASPALRRALSRSDTAIELLKRGARDLMAQRHLDAPWRREPIELAAEIRAALAGVEALSASSERATSRSDPLFVALAPMRELARLSPSLDPERLEAGLVALASQPLPDRLGSGRYGPGVERDQLKAELTRVRGELAVFARRVSADLAVSLRDELMEAVRAYDALKARHGSLDFDDLLLRARDVLRRDGEVLAELRARLGPFFVDEFQDTDPIQAQILLLLSGEGDPVEGQPFEARIGRGRLFVVGDPKQSIYRFRHADPGTYELVRRLVVASGGEVLELSASFRSVPGLLDYVNAAFSPVMRRDELAQQASYVELTPRRSPPAGGAPSVIALPVPAPYGKRRLAKSAVRLSLPDALAGFISWLIEESGLTIEDPQTGATSKIAARHVVVLVRTMASYGDAGGLAAALTRLGVAVVVSGASSLEDQEESHAIVTALQAIEAPGDPLLVYATLRGLLFGLTDGALFEWIRRYGPLRATTLPVTAVPPHLSGVLEALLLLSELSRRKNSRPYAETLAQLLSDTRAHVGVALAPSAEQAFLQLVAIEQIAAAQERSGKLSFGAFVEELEASSRARSPSVDDAADDARGGVRIMTVHGAKGLEFPVVILADPSEAMTREPGKVVDVSRGLCALRIAECSPWDLLDARELELTRQRAESARLAYVAATRARDLLVFPVVGDDPGFPAESWLGPLTRLLGPGPGADVVMNRPHDVERPARSLGAGPQTTAGGQVLVFDPRWLGAGKKSPLGVRDDLVSRSAPPSVVEADRQRFEAAAEARRSALTSASRSAGRLVTVTTLAKTGASAREAGPEVELCQTERQPDRPRGKRFGTLVHWVLSTAPLDASEQTLHAVAAAVAKLAVHDPAEVDAARYAATAALGHPLVRRAARSGTAQRELPVTLRLDDDVIADGVVDLVFEEAGELVIVDYKTDDPGSLLSEHLAGYCAQVRLYARALALATGKPARAALLFV